MVDRLKLLQAISTSAKDLASFALSRGASPIPQPVGLTDVTFDPLPLPDLNALHRRLKDAGLPPKTTKSAIKAYDEACSRWRSTVDESFKATASAVSPRNLHLLLSLRHHVYAQQVQKWLWQVLQVPELWKAEMAKQRAHITATMDTYKKPRPKFHSEYTPLLELYFHFNAYPTFADRRMLAEKTGMQTRQITVWFQNHRRRAKGPLPRMAPTDKIPMEEFERQRENMARKLLPVLLPSHLRPAPSGSENASPARSIPRATMSAAKSKKPDGDKEALRKVGKKALRDAAKTAKANSSTVLGALVAAGVQQAPEAKNSKKAKKAARKNAQDVEMRDATKSHEKRRKTKAMPRPAGQVPMDVDGRAHKKSTKTTSSAFDSKAELAFARMAYPAPSPYAWVHTAPKSSHVMPSAPFKDAHISDIRKLGKGKPSQNLTSTPATFSTVPPRRTSSRLNAMRPPYAFPATYDSASVPMTFAAAQTLRFSFVTDSQAFGFRQRYPLSVGEKVHSGAIDALTRRFESLRVLCAEFSTPKKQTSSFERQTLCRLRAEGLKAGEIEVRHLVAADSYAARRAITYVTPRAPLDSVVVDLPRALQLRLVKPLVPAEPIVRPDDFAPFVALAEKRAKRRARKEKKKQAEKEARKEEKRARKEAKQAKKDRKEQRAGLPRRSPSTLDSSRASSVTSDASATSRKSRTSRKPRDSSASSVASARTPSLSSTSSRRSSGTSMPATPRMNESLPVVASDNFVLGTDKDVTMTPELMAQLFGEDDASGLDEPMQSEGFSPDMLIFSSCNDGALGDMTADVNMPELGDLSDTQLSFDDMNWTSSMDLSTQPAASFDSSSETSSMDFNWLLPQCANTAPDWSALIGMTPSTTSQIHVLGGTYSCELGGTNTTNAPLNFADLSFELDAGEDCFINFDHNPLGGTMLAV
uniref:Mating-type protein A-alpha Y3 n=1 Tax=Schizophyllum commune TaxID=5334 RepID=MAAY3_SCHCO|nr:RecName: Full=Mating-type protein A-alpha Y3 [Schizophyllum commune]AAB01370.1 A-alpha-Y3 protein [Schizophyllum commune]